MRTQTSMLDQEPSTGSFLSEVTRGLQQSPKWLPSKFFYDERGSQLFDRICELDEYYPTRCELAIMRRYGAAMARQMQSGVMLVEYGSGSSVKTRMLLDHLESPAAYVPVDISCDHLQSVADALAQRYPDIEVLPVCADFSEPFDLPAPEVQPSRRVVYFPGSTIGNFEPTAARDLLARIATQCGSAGGLLIGVDLKKERAVLESAYNDAAGVTAAFNLNLLTRINRELGADFRPDDFSHLAEYNDQAGRIEMHLISRRDQEVSLAGESFAFAEGERICTEYSYKYAIDEFAALALEAGFTLRDSWTDEDDLFAVLRLITAA